MNRKSHILNKEFVILDRNMADLVVNKLQFCTRQLSVDFIDKYWKILKIKIKFFSTSFKIDSWKVNKTAIAVRKTSEPKCTYLNNPNTIVFLFLFTKVYFIITYIDASTYIKISKIFQFTNCRIVYECYAWDKWWLWKGLFWFIITKSTFSMFTNHKLPCITRPSINSIIG